MTKSKDRGTYYEQKIAKHIRDRFSFDKWVCRRASSSGTEELEFGDIVFNDPTKFPAVIECKFGYGWNFKALWPDLNKIFIDFLDEAMIAGDKYRRTIGKEPVVFVVFSRPYWPQLVLTVHKLDINAVLKPKTSYVYNGVPYELYIYDLDDMLDYLGEEVFDDVRTDTTSEKD